MANEKEFTFGTCEYQRTNPPLQDLSKDTSGLNILLSFEEALKLNLAIDECVRKLNNTKEALRLASELHST